MWLLLILLSAFSQAILGEIARPKRQQAQKPPGVDEVRYPSNSETRPVPVVFGTKEIKGPHVLYSGDYKAEAVTKKQWVSPFSYQNVVTGYRYYYGLDLGLCHGPIDAITEIKYGSHVVWAGSAAHGSLITASGTWAAGELTEGVRASVEVHLGIDNQDPSPYLEARLGAGEVPGYGGIAHIVWRGPSPLSGAAPVPDTSPWSKYRGYSTAGWSGWIGNSTSLQGIAVTVRWLPNNLGVPQYKEPTPGDANPAEVIYACATNEAWGAGVSASLVDLPSFQAAAATLHAEAHGVSLLWDGVQPVSEFVDHVCRQIGGYVIRDPYTAKMRLGLVRADYTLANTPILDESNILSLESFTRASLDEATNQLRVVYSEQDQASGKERCVLAKDTAAMVSAAQVISATVNYPGVSNQTLASQIATRDLRALSAPLATASLKCAALTDAITAAEITPKIGDVVRFTWPPLGITDMPMRITNIYYGKPFEQGLSLNLLEDVFNAGSTVFAAPPPVGYTSSDPLPALHQGALLAPYYFTRRDTESLMLWATAPNFEHTGWSLLVQAAVDAQPNPLTAEPEVAGQTHSFSVVGTLNHPWDNTHIHHDAVGFQIQLANPSDVVRLWSPGPTGAQNGEIFACIRRVAAGIAYEEWVTFETVTTVSGGLIQLSGVYRGCLDSSPIPHYAGEEVILVMGGECIDDAPFLLVDDATGIGADGYAYANLFAQTRTPKGQLDWHGAPYTAISPATYIYSEKRPDRSGTTFRRAATPYPPALVYLQTIVRPALEGSVMPPPLVSPDLTQKITLSWKNKNRTTGTISPYSFGNESAEDGVTTMLRVSRQFDVPGEWTVFAEVEVANGFTGFDLSSVNENQYFRQGGYSPGDPVVWVPTGTPFRLEIWSKKLAHRNDNLPDNVFTSLSQTFLFTFEEPIV